MDSGLWERVHCSSMSAFGDQFPSILLSDISALDAPPLCKASTSMWLLRACEAALIILQFYSTTLDGTLNENACLFGPSTRVSPAVGCPTRLQVEPRKELDQQSV